MFHDRIPSHFGKADFSYQSMLKIDLNFNTHTYVCVYIYTYIHTHGYNII